MNIQLFNKRKSSSHTLYCFSPPVMIVTFIFEFGAAIFLLWKYKLNNALRLVVSILAMLGLFQVAEYYVCGGVGVDAATWSRIGYMAITTLPPLGLHLIHTIAGKKIGKLSIVSYALMAAFMVQFMLVSNAFVGHQCTGNYVIFQLNPMLGKMYYLYYYTVLLFGIVFAMKWSRESSRLQSKTAARKVFALRSMVVGYLLFMFPTTIVNTIRPETRKAIPSIMCGFAILFAIILYAYVAPKVAKQKSPILLKNK